MRLHLFGSARIDGNGSLSGRDRQVLALLVAHGRDGCSADQIATAIYGEDIPATWRKVLQGAVVRIRKGLGPLAVETTATGYRLTLGDDEIDVRRFERLVAQAEALAGSGEPDRAAVVLREALDLGRGEPYADLDGWEPARGEAARLGELQRVAEERYVDALLATGQDRAAVGPALTNVEREPLREQRWAALALAQYRCGRQADALRSLNRARHVLSEQLGLEPGPDLAELEQRILAQDPDLAGAEAFRSASTVCPYKGLQAYGLDDGEDFFGREAAVDECLARLARTSVLVIVGPSGSGKSSLARAGVGTRLRTPARPVRVITPGSHPMAALDAVPGGAALVVDQLEELFTMCESDEERAAFVAALGQRRTPVVMTLRADHLASVPQVPGLAALVEAGLYLLRPMGDDDLRAAIEGPAARSGLRLEAGLVDLVLRDVRGQPGALPLLSHALTEVWTRREGPVLTAAAYREVGGVGGAVGRTAEQAFDGLDAASRAVARDLFLRLVTIADGEPVRLRLPRGDLVQDESHTAVLDALARARLLTVDDATVQVAHEALANAWPRLRTWLDDDADGQRIRRHLSATAAGWAAAGRDEGELYRGARLRATHDWMAATTPSLTPTERDFLEASAELARRTEADAATRAEEQARANRRLRRYLRATAVAGVLLLLAATVAIVQRSRAEDSRQAAESQRREVSFGELAARTALLRDTRSDLAALLSVAGYRLRPDNDSFSRLLATFTSAPTYDRTLPTRASQVWDSKLSPDARSVLVAANDLSVTSIDLDSGEETELIPSSTGVPIDQGGLDRSADGRLLARLSRPDPDNAPVQLTVTDLQTGRDRFTVPTELLAGSTRFSPDGDLIAISGNAEGTTEVRSAGDGRVLQRITGLPKPPEAVLRYNTAALRFLPDGRLAIASEAGPLRLVDPVSGNEVTRIEAPQERSNALLVTDADGRYLVGTGIEGLTMFDLQGGKVLWSEPYSPCASLAFIQRLGVVLCGGDGADVRTYDLDTGVEVPLRLTFGLGPLNSLDVSRDGRTVVGTRAGQVAVWRLDGDAAPRRLLDERVAYDAHFDDDGHLLANLDGGDGEPAPRLLDPDTGEVVDELRGIVSAGLAGPGVLGVTRTDGSQALYDTRRHAFVPAEPDDGSPRGVDFEVLGIAPAGDRTIVWGEFQIQGLKGSRRVAPSINLENPLMASDPLLAVFVSPEGKRLYTLETDVTSSGNAVLRRRTSVGEPTGDEVEGIRVAAAAGDLVVAATWDGRLLVLDGDTLEPTGRPLPGLSAAVIDIAVSKSGRRALLTLDDRTFVLADLTSRTTLGTPIDLIRTVGVTSFHSTALRGDGTQAAIGTDRGLLVWDLSPERLVRAACRVAGRDLTRQEWSDYVGDLAPYRRLCP